MNWRGAVGERRSFRGGRAHLRGADKYIDGHEALGSGHPGQRRPEEEDEKEARGVEDPDEAVAFLAQPVVCAVEGGAALAARKALSGEKRNPVRRARYDQLRV